MRDTAKMTCGVGGCHNVAEVKAAWKFGKGVKIPYDPNGGRCASPTGMTHEMQLCRTHRIEAINADLRPFKIVLTTWMKNPDKYERELASFS